MNTNAVTNAILSFIIPGLGQAINGDRQKAITLFLGMIVLHFLVYFFLNNPLGSGVSTLYHIYAGYDAYKSN